MTPQYKSWYERNKEERLRKMRIYIRNKRANQNVGYNTVNAQAPHTHRKQERSHL
jgi:hypothetical protein